MGPGYDETYLQGLRGVVQQTMQQRQMQDAAQERAYARRLQEQGLQRQYQQMDQQQANQQAQLAFRDRELATKAALQERLGRERLDAMRAQAAERNQNRPIQTVDIVAPDDPTKVLKIDPNVYREDAYKSGNRAGVIGVTGKTPDAAKKDQAKESGKARLSSTVDDLSTAYDNLEKMGAVIDPNNSTLGNIYERAAASGPGQFIAGALGTPAQTQRDIINQRRAGLMANMKEATGMSAQSLNSNAELMFYIQMATDPTKSIQANRAALTYLDRTFGLGLGVNADPAAVEELKKVAPKARATGGLGPKPAPAQAIDYLKANPSIPMKEAFKRKYGYVPDGI